MGEREIIIKSDEEKGEREEEAEERERDRGGMVASRKKGGREGEKEKEGRQDREMKERVYATCTVHELIIEQYRGTTAQVHK